MTFQMTRKTESGFTLVELAIVLMIIGLLIGGILRGQELMENARVTSTIQQTKAYDGAVTTFRDSYSALPGDIMRPGQRLANCTAAPCSTAGTSDNIVGTPATSTSGTYVFGPTTENRRFWLHLAVARLISGVDASGSDDVSWGAMYPAARIGGGFHVVFMNVAAAGANPAVSGHFLVLRSNPNAGNIAEATGTAAISPLRAAQIDRKLDDGVPNTGDVLGVGSNTNCTGVSVSNGPLGYGEASEVRDCNLLIRVQN